MRNRVCMIHMAWLLAGCLIALTATGAEFSQVRLPLFRGIWYPHTGEALRKACEQYISDATLPMPVRGRVIACVAPNAGYIHSGSTAAYAFKPLSTGQYDRVIVLTAAHTARFAGTSVPVVQHYATPLGLVPLDVSACRRVAWSSLIETRAVSYHDIGRGASRRLNVHEFEHGIEVLLPFLQVQLGHFELVPLVVGDLMDAKGRIRSGAVRSIAGVLNRVVDERTLVVVSSNLTHYGQQYRYTPFSENVAEGIEWLDKQALHYVLNRDLEGFLDYLENTRNTIDGAAPLAILIALLPKRVEGYLLNYTSGAREVAEGGSSVSYAALVFSDPAVPPNESRQRRQVTPWEPADTSDISLDGITGDGDTAGRLPQDADESSDMPEE